MNDCIDCGHQVSGKRSLRCESCKRLVELTYNRRYYAEHREERNAVSVAWSKAHPEKKREWAKRWYYANRERALANVKKYAAANPEKIVAQYRSYYERTKPAWFKRSQIAWHKRRALFLAAEGSFTEADWETIKERQRQCCYDCHGMKKLTIGHAVPLSKGGSNWPTNIIAQCMRCNLKQGSKVHPSFEETI